MHESLGEEGETSGPTQKFGNYNNKEDPHRELRGRNGEPLGLRALQRGRPKCHAFPAAEGEPQERGTRVPEVPAANGAGSKQTLFDGLPAFNLLASTGTRRRASAFQG